MLESTFQRKTRKEIEDVIFPDCIVKRNEPWDHQGFPDLTIFKGRKYAHLEFKRSADAVHQPNQDYYIDLFNKMGAYAAFIYPENKEEIIEELKDYFNQSD